jgi:hypothetical protein
LNPPQGSFLELSTSALEENAQNTALNDINSPITILVEKEDTSPVTGRQLEISSTIERREEDASLISFTKEGESLPNQPTLEEYIYIDSDNYWKELAQYHNERKAKDIEKTQAKKEEKDSKDSVALEDYNLNLYQYLHDNIYHRVPVKRSKFKSALKEVGFEIKTNKKGKGSLAKVFPKSDNLAYGEHTSYAHAFFNIHLPHDESEIPMNTFFFLQTGFEHIFGLSKDKIDNYLGMKGALKK